MALFVFCRLVGLMMTFELSFAIATFFCLFLRLLANRSIIFFSQSLFKRCQQYIEIVYIQSSGDEGGGVVVISNKCLSFVRFG